MSDSTNAQMPFCVSSSPTAGPTISVPTIVEVSEIRLSQRVLDVLRRRR